MSQTTLRPQKTALLVAQQIVADIQRRGNVPGDRLPPEKAMLEQYQIGRGTLRESLRYLELQGLISLKPGPGGGPVVEKPTGIGLATVISLLLQMENAPYRNIIEARGSLEPAMSRLAASRMTDDELSSLRANLDRMLADIDDPEVFADANQEFHDIIAHSSGNALFAHMIDALTGILDGTSIGIEYPEHRRLAVHQAHTRIYETLAAHDPVAAADAMREHIGEYTQYIEAKYPEVVEAPISWT
ncbi:FadR/GntR family transcriptional regulator [Microbacterium sp. CPCC 204701]|uniref:FadR/GntR family transcriptional regulator n=1 Tax=Microbacterium sp. CPCC 204701 TaxID=2493084 RepID=UPI000FD92460|nr:FadR/GntR family transcriptional regulator [Microbacterium sp. CPCC 204701]